MPPPPPSRAASAAAAPAASAPSRRDDERARPPPPPWWRRTWMPAAIVSLSWLVLLLLSRLPVFEWQERMLAVGLDEDDAANAAALSNDVAIVVLGYAVDHERGLVSAPLARRLEHAFRLYSRAALAAARRSSVASASAPALAVADPSVLPTIVLSGGSGWDASTHALTEADVMAKWLRVRAQCTATPPDPDDHDDGDDDDDDDDDDLDERSPDPRVRACEIDEPSWPARLRRRWLRSLRWLSRWPSSSQPSAPPAQAPVDDDDRQSFLAIRIDEDEAESATAAAATVLPPLTPRFLLERESTSTRTNAFNVLRMLVASRSAQHLVIVTNRFHQWRSRAIFRRLARSPEFHAHGFHVHVSPTPSTLTEHSVSQLDWWRELAAIVYYWWMGWLDVSRR